MAKTHLVPFSGTQIPSVLHKNQIYVPVRPLVDTLELTWSCQAKKLKHPRFKCVDIATVAADGKSRTMLCVPHKRFDTWLNSINPLKVRNTKKRKRLELYQEESSDALYEYWHGSKEIEPPKSPEEKTLTTLCIMKSLAEGVPLEGVSQWLTKTIEREQILVKCALDQLEGN